jgi:hypothetical protein
MTLDITHVIITRVIFVKIFFYGYSLTSRFFPVTVLFVLYFVLEGGSDDHFGPSNAWQFKKWESCCSMILIFPVGVILSSSRQNFKHFAGG